MEEAELEVLRQEIKNQGDEIRQLKEQKADPAVVSNFYSLSLLLSVAPIIPSPKSTNQKFFSPKLSAEQIILLRDPLEIYFQLKTLLRLRLSKLLRGLVTRPCFRTHMPFWERKNKEIN